MITMILTTMMIVFLAAIIIVVFIGAPWALIMSAILAPFIFVDAVVLRIILRRRDKKKEKEE